MRKRHRRARGFSVIEVLIASALLLLIAVGVLPLFAQALINNVAGSDATQTSNATVTNSEASSQLRFNTGEISWTTGTTQLDWAPAYLMVSGSQWLPSYPSTDAVRLTRDTTVRQYQITDIEAQGRLVTPLPGNAIPGVVHLKEVEVRVHNAFTTAAPNYTVRYVKSF